MIGQVFRAYVERDLVPTQRPGDVVVLDNLACHRNRAARRTNEAAGAELRFLPPDSPIEFAFSKLKALLRTDEAQSRDTLWQTVGSLLDISTPPEPDPRLASAEPTRRNHAKEEAHARGDRRAAAAGGRGGVATCHAAGGDPENGVSEAPCRRCRNECGELKLDQVKRLKELEQENARPRGSISGLTLDALILQESLRGNRSAPPAAERRTGRHARRRALPTTEDEGRLTAAIVAPATTCGRCGCRRIAVLLRQAGWRGG